MSTGSRSQSTWKAHSLHPLRKWKADQEERIRARDAASEQKRQGTIAKAEEAIDQFYKEYNARKERSIADNK